MHSSTPHRVRSWLTYYLTTTLPVQFPSEYHRRVLVICGTDKVNPITVTLAKTLFPHDHIQYVLVGFHGRHCRVDVTRHEWWRKCFGNNATMKMFDMIVIEYCDKHIVPKVISSVRKLLTPDGFLVNAADVRLPPSLFGDARR